MTDLSADMDAIRVFGATCTKLGAELAAAGAGAAAAGPALLAPVFGAVGSEFLDAFAAAHEGQVAAIGELARLYDSLGTTAGANAADYDGTDHATGAALDGTSTGGVR